jgi:hypothetical protein
MHETRIRIDWKYSGKPDGFFGTGATNSEQTLVWIFGLVGTAILGWLAWAQSFPWTWWQYVLAGLLALDVLGGVVANALNSCKRFYHSPLQPEETGFTALSKNHVAFSLFHVHPLIVGLFFGEANLLFAIFWYTTLILSTFIVLQTPLYLRRPMAFGIIMMAVLLNFYAIDTVRGFEWLVPALFLKIIYGHNVREEPYRP